MEPPHLPSPSELVDILQGVGLAIACHAVAEAVAVDQDDTDALTELVAAHNDPDGGADILSGVYEGFLILVHTGVGLLNVTPQGDWDPVRMQTAAQVADLRGTVPADSYELLQAARRYAYQTEFMDYLDDRPQSFPAAYTAAVAIVRLLVRQHVVGLRAPGRWQVLGQITYSALRYPRPNFG
ncbi:hypothetical protein D5S17_35970 [Pseudonocardiaceae bacterium YIM PH 21723]|nr:hypothetical protein D5S17_35970 [Pseudonocardiaceae bacterium YIM PH 21723]